MPDISLPEVRLKDRLPDGLRDMSMDDIQKALPEVRLPKLELGRDARKAAKAAEKAARQAMEAAERAAADAGKQADRMAKQAQKTASREAGKAAKTVEHALPRRSGPNPVPIAILAMVGGAVVGWILASNPTTGPRISAWLDDLRMRFEQWRGRAMDRYSEEDWDTTQPQAFTEAGRAPISSERYIGQIGESETGVGVGPGHLPEGMGTSDPSRTTANEPTH